MLSDLKGVHVAKPTAGRTVVDVKAILEVVRRQKYAPDAKSVLPFAERYFEENAGASFVQMSYLYLLGRPADFAGLRGYTRKIESGASASDVWEQIIESDEFLGRPTKSFVGPFDPDFPFGRNAFL